MLISWLPSHAGGASFALILAVALAIDAAFGDPPALYRIIPHPVVLMGRLVGAFDSFFNDEARPKPVLIVRGALTVLTIVSLAGALGWALSFGLRQITGGWIVEALLASMLLSFRSLFNHVRAVQTGLGVGLVEGRAAVGHIVGRDCEALDEAGVARAAIESAAENFSDGTVAPVFWFLLLGLPGLLAYKAINTLDSMIGHRTPRHDAFGRVAARLDDGVNWLPARIAGGLIMLAAFILPGFSGQESRASMLRDAKEHASPNAGWPEAAMAGALGLALAGPRRYGERDIDGAWMGQGRRDATAADIRRALSLYLTAGLWLALMVAVMSLAPQG